MKKLLAIILIVTLYSCNGNENQRGATCPEIRYNVTNNSPASGEPDVWPVVIKYYDSASVKHNYPFTSADTAMLNARSAAHIND